MESSLQSYGASPAIDHTWMGSHSIIRHQTQVNAPRLYPSRTGRYWTYLPQRDGRLSWPWCWSYT